MELIMDNRLAFLLGFVAMAFIMLAVFCQDEIIEIKIMLDNVLLL